MGREHNDAVKELAQRRTVPLPPRGRCYHASSLFPAATKVFHDFFGLLHAKSGTASCAGGTGKQFLVRDTLHVVAQYVKIFRREVGCQLQKQWTQMFAHGMNTLPAQVLIKIVE